MMNDFISSSHACLLNSNSMQKFYREDEYDFILAYGCREELRADNHALDSLQSFINRNQGQWMFGVISYDVKNEIENLVSQNDRHVTLPLIHFFIPEKIILKKKNEPAVLVEENKQKIVSGFELDLSPGAASFHSFSFSASPGREEYLKTIDKLKTHIQKGNIYEVTFCVDFFAEQVNLNSWEVYKKLNSLSPSPMSCYFRAGPHHLISSSPERFLKKKKEQLVSQPIKGTSKRSHDSTVDEQLKKALHESEKERSENVMIVDLVRNDLSRIAQRGSVHVDELFGIYSLTHVHQMISTIRCRMKPELAFTDVMKAAFPMGSMTGAPKISAMKLIDEHERFARGWFSGCAGYINPEGDFDFNVIIRSILYNSAEQKLSFPAGSAITMGSDAEKEYEECLLKAEMMRRALE